MSDLINRQATIAKAKTLFRYGIRYVDEPTVIGMLDKMPTIEAPEEQKTGEWVNDGDYVPQCSECGYVASYIKILDKFDRSDFCPNCGARMKGADDEMR